MPTSSTTVPASHGLRRLVGAAALVLLAGAALTACASEGSAPEGQDGATTTTVNTPADEVTTTVDPAGTTDGSSTGGSTTGGSTTGGSTTGQPSAPAPTIASFTTPENIDCHNGNLQEFTASWTTANAVDVTISIDGPGVYDTYPANGEASLPFNCSSSHTFLLTAHGSDGQTATRSITLDPRNVQSSSSDDEQQ